MSTHRRQAQAEQAIIKIGLTDFEVKKDDGRISMPRGDGRNPKWYLLISGKYYGWARTLDFLVELAEKAQREFEAEIAEADDLEMNQVAQELPECDGFELKADSSFKEGMRVKGVYFGQEYRGLINSETRPTPDYKNMQFCVTLDSEIVVFGKTRQLITVITNNENNTIFAVEETEEFEAEQELAECDEVIAEKPLKISVVFTATDRDYKLLDKKIVEYEIKSVADLTRGEIEWKRDFDEFRKHYKTPAGFPSEFLTDFNFHAPVDQKERMLKAGFQRGSTPNMLRFTIINFHTVMLDAPASDICEDFNDEPTIPEQIALAEKEVIAEAETLTRATNISRKITYNSGAWIEINYLENVATVSDPENSDLVELARLILTGFEECNKAVDLQSKFAKCDDAIINTTFAVHRVESTDDCDVMVYEVYNNWLERYETNSEFKTQKEAADRMSEIVTEYNQESIQPTITYIAKPQDPRFLWWCVQVPEDQELDGKRINAPFLKKGTDLELKLGDMLIDSEANHHRKNRGFSVVLIVCDGEKIRYIHPMAQRKAFIKANGGHDLMHESGDVNGCIRMAVWLRRQPDMKLAIEQLLKA